MQFPNAYKGVKKIWLAELMMLAAAVLGIVLVVILVAGGLNATGNVEDIHLNDTQAGATLGLTLTVSLLVIVAFVIMLIGVINAKKDDNNFRIALYAILLGILLSSGNAIAGSSQPKIQQWLTLGSSICSLFSTYYIISGVMSLAEKLGNSEVRALGEKARNILCFTFAASALLKLVPQFLDGPNVSNIINLIGHVLDIISYGFFLVLLTKGKKMLAE